MTVRAKFCCHFIQKADDNSHCTIHVSPVTTDTPENKTWSKYTPGGLLQMHISNPAAFSQFEQGKEYTLISSQRADKQALQQAPGVCLL